MTGFRATPTSTLLTACMLALAGCGDDPAVPMELLDDAHSGVSSGPDSLRDRIDPSRAVAGFMFDITEVGDDITLDFAPQPGATEYTLWESSDPYFAPADASSIALGTSTDPSFVITNGATASDSTYWRVTADTGSVSTTGGVWVQSLVTGYNNLGYVLLGAGPRTPEELGALYPSFGQILVFIPGSENRYVIWEGTGQANQPWGEGEGVTVRNDGPPMDIRLVGIVPVEEDFSTLLEGTGSWIAAPLWLDQPTDAQTLSAELGGITELRTLNVGTQQLESFFPPAYGVNFTITPGQVLWPNGTGTIAWPPNQEIDALCGNGAIEDSEICDDGNTLHGDGCNATCSSDETCANGIVDFGETCDDGNTADGDGCNATCTSDETCGNGVVDPLEECDDGNLVDDDGCTNACTMDWGLDQGACAGWQEPSPGVGAECVIFEALDGSITDYTIDVMASPPNAPYELNIVESGTLTLCEGTYPLGIRVAIPDGATPQFTLVGAGSGLTVLDLTQASDNTLRGFRWASLGTATASGFTVRGGLTDGISAHRQGTTISLSDVGVDGAATGITGLHKITLNVDGAWVRNSNGHGIQAAGSNSLGAEHRTTPGGYTFHDVCSENNGSRGLNGVNTDWIHVSNSQFRDNAVQQVRLHQVRDVSMTDSMISGHANTGAAVLIQAGSTDPSHWRAISANLGGLLVVENDSTDGPVGGIENVSGWADVTCTDTVVEDNTPGDLLNLSCAPPL